MLSIKIKQQDLLSNSKTFLIQLLIWESICDLFNIPKRTSALKG